MNDLTPAENDVRLNVRIVRDNYTIMFQIVYTKFNIIGLNDLDNLPPVNIKSISSVRTVKKTPSVGGSRPRE